MLGKRKQQTEREVEDACSMSPETKKKYRIEGKDLAKTSKGENLKINMEPNSVNCDRVHPLTINISRLSEAVTKSAMEKISLSDPTPTPTSNPKQPETSKTESRTETEETTEIMESVDTPEFDELDITTKLDILDTSKKKLEEIKRKSEEQVEMKMVENCIETVSNDNETNIVENIEAEVEENDGVTVKTEKWSENEKILCFHGPLIYEAKIQKIEVQNEIPKYFIHYKGWNKNWDEWVPEARMLKFSDENITIQKDLCHAHTVKESVKKQKQKQEHIFAVPKNPSPVPKKEERGRRKAGIKPKKREENHQTDDFLVKNGKHLTLKSPDNTVETLEHFESKLEIKIKIPDELKSYIVDDWNQICKKRKLCVLPARICADQLINEYIKAKTINKAEKLKNNKEKAIVEVTAGIREYFNVMLSSQLLYKFERGQYEQQTSLNANLQPSKVYGVVHLLRLFTKLGEILIYTPLSEKSVNLLLFYVNDILTYMKKNASLIFSLADYEKQTSS